MVEAVVVLASAGLGHGWNEGRGVMLEKGQYLLIIS